MSLYAEVIIINLSNELDKVFHYAIPFEYQEIAQIGMRVIVPFGRNNKNREGFIINFCEKVSIEITKIKNILSLPDDYTMFSKNMLQIAFWMKQKYYTSLANCLKCVMPSGINLKSNYYISVLELDKNFEGDTAEIIEYIKSNNNKVSADHLLKQFGNKLDLNNLEKKGIVKKYQISHIKDYKIYTKILFLNENIDNIDIIIENLKIKNKLQSNILELLKNNKSMPVLDIKYQLGISDSPINSLIKKDYVYIKKIEMMRKIGYLENDENTFFELTADQKYVIDTISAKFSFREKKPILLHGVTGSGKTEVYLRLVQMCISLNKQAIILIPEISLTSQTVSRFVKKFGNYVTFTHSKLSFAERYEQWKKAKKGDVKIIIGPRSAIFTQFENLGLIIIDEEHENSYISESTPKFNTKEVAIKLSQITNSLLVFASATPSIDTYYHCKQGDYELICMKNRINEVKLQTNIVDMRQELVEGNRSIFSQKFICELKQTLQNNEQAIIFLNRRGHSTFINCRSCGYVMSCTNCNVNYTYHKNSNKVICHYCNDTQVVPSKCNICGSKYIKFFGIGTQKIEEEIKKIFPNENVIRMDADTVTKKNSYDENFRRFRKGDARILIGTQMIAKGLDFPNVSLVCVVSADIALNVGDFRSAENTYQLLVQVSGRAGRGNTEGKVFIQTYNPEHYSIFYAKNSDYEQFYQHEISLRKQMMYPPFTSIFCIIFISKSEKDVIKISYSLFEIMKFYNKKQLYDILGPAPCIISKIKNEYRWKLLVKNQDETNLKNFVMHCIKKLDKSNVMLNITLNPINIS